LPVKQTDDAREMLRADLENENATIRAYRERVMQCKALQEYAMAEDIREILRQEQERCRRANSYPSGPRADRVSWICAGARASAPRLQVRVLPGKRFM